VLDPRGEARGFGGEIDVGATNKLAQMRKRLRPEARGAVVSGFVRKKSGDDLVASDGHGVSKEP
jgi:hypothetical protein